MDFEMSIIYSFDWHIHPKFFQHFVHKTVFEFQSKF